MSNKNSNKNKQTKSVKSCIEYIDGKPIVKILIVGSYSNFTFKKELGQQYDKFKKGFKENIPLEVVFAQFFKQLKSNCDLSFDDRNISSEDYKKILELVKKDGYAKSSRCSESYFAQTDIPNNSSRLYVVAVDISRPWTIENYDGAEYVRYLDTKDYKQNCSQLNHYIQE